MIIYDNVGVGRGGGKRAEDPRQPYPHIPLIMIMNAHNTHLCIDVRYLLDRATFPRAPVFGGNDAAISALTEFLDELVLGIDNKHRVESIETVSLHDDDVKLVDEKEEKETLRY